ncbi:MAG TPA: glutamate synthase, partial [Archaeoglobaceae archaeon]|nr:glutamate synthase [Archaeoglobaceae archaeon]
MGVATKAASSKKNRTGKWRSFKPVFDKKECKRNYEPIAIGRLERFVADWELSKGVRIPEKEPPTG